MADLGITDEAVEAAVKSLHPGLFEEGGLLHPMLANSGRWDARRKVRAALEAAVPLLAPEPVDREALVSGLKKHFGYCSEGPNCGACESKAEETADAVLALLNGTAE